MVDTVGVTTIVEPLPIFEVPQVALYHSQLALVPTNPPVNPSEVEEPSHMVFDEAVTEEAEIELSFTVTMIFTQSVVLQTPSAFA